jgi:hypothetical protein
VAAATSRALMIQMPREPLLSHVHLFKKRLRDEAYSRVLAESEADPRSAPLLTILCTLRPVTTAKRPR